MDMNISRSIGFWDFNWLINCDVPGGVNNTNKGTGFGKHGMYLENLKKNYICCGINTVLGT